MFWERRKAKIQTYLDDILEFLGNCYEYIQVVKTFISTVKNAKIRLVSEFFPALETQEESRKKNHKDILSGLFPPWKLKYH